MEERRTAELMSDFDDYEIAGAKDDADSDSDELGEAPEPGGKGARKKKKAR
jgi:hypothetical protein